MDLFVMVFRALLSQQNTSQSSLDDSFDQFDGSESQSLQDQPLHKPHRGKQSTDSLCTWSMGGGLKLAMDLLALF